MLLLLKSAQFIIHVRELNIISHERQYRVKTKTFWHNIFKALTVHLDEHLQKLAYLK